MTVPKNYLQKFVTDRFFLSFAAKEKNKQIK